MGIAEKVAVFDLRGVQTGFVEVEIVPCDKSGQEFQDVDDFFIDDPNQLIGTNVYFRLTILGCRSLPTKYEVIQTNEHTIWSILIAGSIS